jgi:nucleotide-binding universal stress UspA family protein
MDPQVITTPVSEHPNVRRDEALFGRIVLATGETDACKRAAAFAREVAQRYGSELIVAEALPSYPMDPIRAQTVIRRALIGLRKWTRKVGLDRFVSERIVVRDEPSEMIAQVLHTDSSQLVLMGTHASRGFERLLLGSVAEELARDVEVPSLIVGPKCAPPFKRFVRFRKLLFATDLSTSSFSAVKFLRKVHAATAAEVFVVPECVEDVEAENQQIWNLHIHVSFLSCFSLPMFDS